ncbi:hypothetical protein ACHAXS_010363 [Conticribra weissflogii]
MRSITLLHPFKSLVTLPIASSLLLISTAFASSSQKSTPLAESSSTAMTLLARFTPSAAGTVRNKILSGGRSRARAAFVVAASSRIHEIWSEDEEQLPESLHTNKCLRSNPIGLFSNSVNGSCSNFHPYNYDQHRSFHTSSTLLMMAKRKKNGGKSKKANSLQNGKKKKKLSVIAVSEDDDDVFDISESEAGATLDLESLQEKYDLEGSGKGDDEDDEADWGEESELRRNAPFANDYHAPVMPTECVQALLLQGEWEEMLNAKRDRWRKKQSIIDAKRRKAALYDDNDEENKMEDSGDIEGYSGHDELNQNEAIITPRPRVFIDGTLGGGGHSHAILEQLRAGDILISCDVDPEALATASKRLVEYLGTSDYIIDYPVGYEKVDGQWKEGKPMFIPVQSNFRNLLSVLAKVRHPISGNLLFGDRRKRQNNRENGNSVGEETVEFPYGANGMLLDLGVSSHQIDTGERGFAFMKDGPLDMRMSGTSNNSASAAYSASSLTAADICNEFDESSLVSILKNYGDEPRAKRIASAIVASRPLYTTTDLVHAINSVTPTFARQRRAGLIATCARVFQALRIVVNEEDGALKEVLEEVAPAILRRSGSRHLFSKRNGYWEHIHNGILAVLSYHSMEDKMAKRVIRDGKVDLFGSRRGGGGVLERDLYGNIITEDNDSYIDEEYSLTPFEPLCKPRKATEEEIAVNSRARSATLRVAIRV